MDKLLTDCLANKRQERISNPNDLLEKLIVLYQRQFSIPPKSIDDSGDYAAVDYLGRGGTYHNLQQYEHALADHNRAIELDPNLATAYSNRGLTYADLQQYELALADYRRAIELDSNLATAYTNRGLTYSDLQQYELALADHSRAIELDPNLVPAYSNRGLTYSDL